MDPNVTDGGSASTAYLILGGALVFLMTPGLGLFYSGTITRAREQDSLLFLPVFSRAQPQQQQQSAPMGRALGMVHLCVLDVAALQPALFFFDGETHVLLLRVFFRSHLRNRTHAGQECLDPHQ
jgi:hypothetical protein